MNRQQALALAATVVAVGATFVVWRFFLARPRQQPSKPKSATDEIPDIEDLSPCEHGFDRPLDGQFVEIHGSIKPITYHFLVSTNIPPKQWPSEASEACPLLKIISSSDIPKGQTISAHMYYDPAAASSSQTVLLYPKRVSFTGVTTTNAPALMEAIKSEKLDNLPAGVAMAPISNFQVFICCHRNRDKRCGYCGPVLFAEFEKDLHNRMLTELVKVHKVSHVGGHKYAGNVLVYGPKLLDWYAYVQPSDVRELITTTIIQQDWVPRIWRGRVGVNAEESKQMRDICRNINAGK